MNKLGFSIYDSESESIDIKNDGIIDYELYKIDTTFQLKKGDILMSSDHLHIYIGDGKNPSNNYGWGRVYREYPRKYSFTRKSDDNEYYYLIDEEGDPNHKYTRVFRYGG